MALKNHGDFILKVDNKYYHKITPYISNFFFKTSQIDTTIGKMVPLGFERFRICELFAELLHCSNISSLNITRYNSSSNGYTEDYNN